MFWRGYEIGNLLPYYIFRNSSKILKFPWLNFVIIGPLGLMGMALAIPRWKRLFMLYGMVCVHLATALLFFVLARYRLPVVPVLSIFAAYALCVFWQFLRSRRFLYALLLVVVFAGLTVMLNYPYAAQRYADHYHTEMPLINMLRYWDLFHFQ
jgi:hypothetical protein